MGSINSHKYPEHDIEQAVEITETIHNKGISKPELLAEQLGHSSVDGGAFRNKLTSLRRYGLITGRGEIELTPLAKKVVSPKPNSTEREDAIAESILNIELLKKLYNELDYETPEDDFWFQIVEITDSERSEAKNKAPKIRDLYETGLKYVDKTADSESANSGSSQSFGQPNATGESSNIDQSTSKDIPDGAEAVLVTPDARIEIRSRPTYVAAKALFKDIGSKFEKNETGQDNSEDLTDTGLNDYT